MIIKGTADCIPEEAGYDSGRIAVLNGHFLRMIEKKEIEGGGILHIPQRENHCLQ